MDLELAGKTVLITGGSKGIGKAIAAQMAEEGCNLHLASRTVVDLEAARDEINTKYGAQVTIHPGDLSDSSLMRKLAVDTAGIDILINNAGAIPSGSVEMVDEDTWRDAWDLKVFGYINLIREVYPAMCARGDGVILNVIGAAGERPVASYLAGSMGNASLMAMTLALGAEAPHKGVRVLAVNPGLIETDRMVTLGEAQAMEKHGDKTRWREMLSNLPEGRAGSVEEVADVVTFLASPRASWVSGTVLTIDAGVTKRAGL
ncbi:MAG: short-chain dehydrogenase/reductase [Alphaproteobacteria bacterium]|nr:short-chain dehydrogenase/reductase [Alphaproteobacteria bacterium]